MLTTNGGVKVMDFGIARAVADTSASMTQTAPTRKATLSPVREAWKSERLARKTAALVAEPARCAGSCSGGRFGCRCWTLGPPAESAGVVLSGLGHVACAGLASARRSSSRKLVIVIVRSLSLLPFVLASLLF